MPTKSTFISLAIALGAGVPAQDFDARLRVARQGVDAAELPRVAEQLQQLEPDADTTRRMEALGNAWEQLGVAASSRGRHDLALLAAERCLSLRRQAFEDRDDPDVANAMSTLAVCLDTVGRSPEALPLYEANLAMWERIQAQYPFNPNVPIARNNLALCLERVGRGREALGQYQTALSEQRLLHKDQDTPEVASFLSNLGQCLGRIGRAGEALEHCLAAEAMQRRIHGVDDHASLATSINNVARCYERMAQLDDAMTRFEEALGMFRRLAGGADSLLVAALLNNTGSCLLRLGRPQEALPRFEEAEAIADRLFGGRPHADHARSINNTAFCLLQLGRVDDAARAFERTLVMWRRIYGEQDHPSIAMTLANIGHCALTSGHPEAARQALDTALAVNSRLHGDRDHTDLAMSLHNVAECSYLAGRPDEALPRYEAALAMWRRIHGDRDQPETATAIRSVAECLIALDRPEAALTQLESALAMSLRLHEGRDHQELLGARSSLAGLLLRLDRPQDARPHAEAAVTVAERLRDAARCLSADFRRSLFDHLKRCGPYERLQLLEVGDGRAEQALAVAEQSRSRGLLDLLDQGGDPMRSALLAARTRGDEESRSRIEHMQSELAAQLTLRDRLLHDIASQAGEARPQADSPAEPLDALRGKLRDANDHLRRLRDQQARFVATDLPAGRPRSGAEIRGALAKGELLLVYTVMETKALVYAVSTETDVVAYPLHVGEAELRRHTDHQHQTDQAARGRDPDAPPGGTAESLSARLSLFQRLVPDPLWTRVRNSKRVWIVGHQSLHRLPFEALVVDVRDAAPVYWLDVGPEVAYAPSASALAWLRQRRRAAPSSGADLDLLAVGDPRPEADETTSPGTAPAAAGPLATPVRNGDLERAANLPSLRGARAEVQAIASCFPEPSRVRTLLGEAAREDAVSDLAPRARFVHFACHALAEEYAGQSLSMLVLSAPKQPSARNDGFLHLDELLQDWQGRLDGCDLAVLAACRTLVGPTHRDDAPQALPLGFLLAGARSVISSLWAVDDDSTAMLMTDFYRRLAGGETDRLRAFTAAKRELRRKKGDPHHWAPFLYVGLPQ